MRDLKERYKQLFIGNVFALRKKTLAVIVVLVLTAIGLLMFACCGQSGANVKNMEQQIIALAQNIRKYYSVKADFWGLCTAEVLQQKLYPSDMISENDRLVGAMGKNVVVGMNEEGAVVMPSIRQFVIAVAGLNSDECLALADSKFDEKFWLGVTAVAIKNSVSAQKFEWGNSNFALPLSKKTAKTLCSDKDNVIVYYFE